jgi:hypothetical protein
MADVCDLAVLFHPKFGTACSRHPLEDLQGTVKQR